MLLQSVLSLLLFAACNNNSTPSKDAGPFDVSDSVPEERPQPVDIVPEEKPEATEPVEVLGCNFAAFSQPSEESPVVYLTQGPLDGPDLLKLRVRANHLGMVAGIAFYLEYDPEYLQFESSTTVISFDEEDSPWGSPYFTQSVVKQLQPGVLTYGVARFCKDKIPWAGVDQCGGKEIEHDIFVASFTFALKRAGKTSVRFPGRHALIRAPNRTAVKADWVGGSVNIDLTGGE